MRTLVAGLGLGAGVGLGLLQRSRLAERTLAATGRSRSSRLTHTLPFSVGTKGEARTAGGEPARQRQRTFTAAAECRGSDDGGQREAAGGFPQQKDYCLLRHHMLMTGCRGSVRTHNSIYSKAPPCTYICLPLKACRISCKHLCSTHIELQTL